MQRIQHAGIGAGGKGSVDVRAMGRLDGVEVIAVADVDSRRFSSVLEAHPDARAFADWRKMLTELGDAIDTVSVSTPDHMHGVCSLSALLMGKAVYTQKPLVDRISEGRGLLAASLANGSVTQMGTQHASAFGNRFTEALIKDGAIGKVLETHSFCHKGWGDMAPRPDRADPVPAELDWDLWLGVEEEVPYIEGYCHPSQWRKRQAFGTGTLGDMGCHILSPAYRALGLTAPTSVTSDTGVPNEHHWRVGEHVSWTFPGTEMTEGDEHVIEWHSADRKPPEELWEGVEEAFRPKQGTIFIGTEGKLVAGHASGANGPYLFPREKYADYPYPKLEPIDHYGSFVGAVRAGDPTTPIAHFGVAVPLTEFVLLGCIATKFPDEVLEWDPGAGRITNQPRANAHVRRNLREGWAPLGQGDAQGVA